jgi:CRP/FNR family transcriptional regulator
MDRLFGAGDERGGIFLVREGALKTVSFAPDGEEQILAFHLPGELLGLDAFETGRHRCDAVALGPATVCELPFEALMARAVQKPSLHAQLCRAIGQSAGRDQQHVELLIRRQASERIALFLHGLLERTRPLGESLAELTLPMSREDIARYLGLALETVSRGFTRLHSDGVIRVMGRHIEIRDPEGLRRQARQA